MAALSCGTSSRNLPQLDHVAGRLTLDQRRNKSRPGVERGALLVGERVSLIHADDPAKTPTRVVHHLLDHRQCDPEPRHAARDRAAKIVQSPVGNSRLFVDLVLRPAPSRYRSLSRRAEYERTSLYVRQLLKELDCGIAQRDFVPVVVFHAAAWQRPPAPFKVKLRPSHLADFIPPL